MYYQLIDKKSNIIKIQIFRNNLMYISDDGIYLNDTLLESTNDYSIALFCGDYAIYGNLNSMKRYSLLSHDIEILDWELSYYWDSFENDKVLVSKNRRKDMNGNRIADYYLYNFSNNLLSEIHFTDSPYIKILGKIGLIIRNTTLNYLSLLTGEYEWEVDLGAYGEIDKILGVSAGILWVWLNGYQIVGIEITTGKICRHFSPFKGIFEDGKFYFNFPHFEEEEDKIYFFERNYWIEIDLKSQKTKILWQGQEENINLSVFTKDYIYFISSPSHSVYSNRIGVFDKSAKKIVWSTSLNLETFITLNQIQVGYNKIYVLDSGGTLHIFEKE
jgi:hypothetical protein